MKLRNKFALVWLLVFALAFTFAPTTFAKSFPSKSIEDLTKTWKVRFSQPVDPNSLTSSNIYILDGSQKIETSLKSLDGGYTIEVKPLAKYEAGKVYRLEVSDNIKSTSGKNLKSKTSMSFSVVDSKTAIQSIQHSSGEGLNSFTVKAREDVYAVKINGVDLHLTGWNEFSHTFLNLKSGSKVTIKAYSSTNKVLETKTYTID